MNIFCEACGKEIELISENEEIKCPSCGRICNRGNQESGGAAQDLINKMAGAVGLDDIEGFSLKNLFSEVFRKHTENELEEHWAAGTSGHIPSMDQVNVSWPTPWVFVRFFLITLLAYGILYFGWRQWHNPLLLPGMMFVGCFAVPISLVILFFEFNVRRNVSLYTVIKTFLIGGTLSIILSLIMFRVTNQLGLQWLGSSVAGIAEEIGKLAALIVFVKLIRFPYILNGLLLGAAIGAGFAAFESAGYAFMVFLVKFSQSLSSAASSGSGSANAIDHGALLMINNLTMRGFLTCLAGHILWTGMSGAALWFVAGGKNFKWGYLLDSRFLRIFLIAVVSHMVWNCPWDPQFITPYDKYFLIGIINWIVIIAIVQKGLNQLRDEKMKYTCTDGQEQNISGTENVSSENKENSAAGTAATVACAVEIQTGKHQPFADPAGIRDDVKKSQSREEERKAARFSQRAWQKYYENSEEK